MKQCIEGKTVKVNPQDPSSEGMCVLGHLSLADKDKCVERLQSVFEDVLQETTYDPERLKNIMEHFKENANIRVELRGTRLSKRMHVFLEDLRHKDPTE